MYNTLAYTRSIAMYTHIALHCTHTLTHIHAHIACTHCLYTHAIYYCIHMSYTHSYIAQYAHTVHADHDSYTHACMHTCKAHHHGI